MLSRLPTIRFLIILVAFAGLASSSHADSVRDNSRVAQVVRAQALAFEERFAAADSIYRQIIADNPTNPAGYLFRAGVLFAEMSDAEENLHESLFKSLLDTVNPLSERILDTCDNTTAAWMYLWRGHARAYRALWESKFGSPFRALKLGLSTVDEYEAGLKRDSTVRDLYAGIGSYHYWKSAKAGVLRWLGIFKNEKDKGIAELRRAADSSLLHRDLARSALIWVWLDRKEFDSAVVLAEDFLKRFPESRTFLWPIAQAQFRQAKYGDAAATFSRIRASLEESPGNYHNLIECDYHLTKCCTWLEDDARLETTKQDFLSYRERIPDSTKKRQSDKISFLNRVAKR